MADLESCHVELPGSPPPSESSSLSPQTSELNGVLNLVSGVISAPFSLSSSCEDGDEGPSSSSGTSTHYAMPSREYFSSKDFILLYFSASWCPPCRKLSPVLSRWAKKYKDDVGVVFVSHDRSESEVREM